MYAANSILLIDDSEADSALLELVLRDAEFDGELSIFDSAGLALSALNGHAQNGKATLIFVDLNMPQMDGFAFVDAAAPLLDGNRNIAVVMLTSSTDSDDILRARRTPQIRDYYVKPLTVESARQVMQRFLS